MDRCKIDLRSVDWKIDTMGVHEWLLELSTTADDQPKHFPQAGGTGSWTQICGCERESIAQRTIFNFDGRAPRLWTIFRRYLTTAQRSFPGQEVSKTASKGAQNGTSCTRVDHIIRKTMKFLTVLLSLLLSAAIPAVLGRNSAKWQLGTFGSLLPSVVVAGPLVRPCSASFMHVPLV